MRALREHDGDALLFLPGAGETGRAVAEPASGLAAKEFSVIPLYGDLAAAEQDAALRADAHGRRKVVVATNIAETSLTIEGCASSWTPARAPQVRPVTG